MLISVATVRILVINEASGRTNTDRGCEGRTAEEGEYLLGDKYSTCMLNVDYVLRECLSLCQVILLICT